MFVLTWAHIAGLGTFLGLIGTLAGWWWRTVSQRYDEKMSELEKTIDKHTTEDKEAFVSQWKRIDEIKDNQLKYVTIERHDTSRRETFEAIEKAMQPLTEAIKDLREQMTRMLERQSK